MNGSNLTYGQISEISSNLKTYASNMEDTLNQVKNLFNKVGQEDVWAGTSATAAKEEFDSLAARFPEFITAVNECSNYLSQVVANYQAADKEVMSQNQVQ